MRAFLIVLLDAALTNIKTPSPGKITNLFVKEMDRKGIFVYTVLKKWDFTEFTE